MTRLARFVSSPAGRVYARACERYGTDPAAIFSDPIIAANARVGFLVMELDAQTPDDPAPEVDVRPSGRIVASGFDPLGERRGG